MSWSALEPGEGGEAPEMSVRLGAWKGLMRVCAGRSGKVGHNAS